MFTAIKYALSLHCFRGTDTTKTLPDQGLEDFEELHCFQSGSSRRRKSRDMLRNNCYRDLCPWHGEEHQLHRQANKQQTQPRERNKEKGHTDKATQTYCGTFVQPSNAVMGDRLSPFPGPIASLCQDQSWKIPSKYCRCPSCMERTRLLVTPGEWHVYR